MSIYRDKKRGCFVFDFSRTIEGQRIRSVKSLPRSWNQAQADAYDRQESARLYAVATRVTAPDYLIEQAVEKYVTHRCPELKHGRGAAQELHALMPFYVGRPLSSLIDVCKAIKIKHDRLKPATVMNKIRYLTSACRYAWRHHSMGNVDPAAGVTVPSVKNARNVYVTRSEVVRLSRACEDKPTRAAILIAFYSGMRQDEIRRAVLLDGLFVLHDTKNGDARYTPVRNKLLGIVRNPRLWPITITGWTISHHFTRATRKAGMPWATFHTLRHSTASEMINAGVSLNTVGEVLGHRSAASTRRYAHLQTGAKGAALAMVGKKVA